MWRIDDAGGGRVAKVDTLLVPGAANCIVMQLQSTTWSHCAQKGCFNFAAAGSCIPYCAAFGSFETIFSMLSAFGPPPQVKGTRLIIKRRGTLILPIPS